MSTYKQSLWDGSDPSYAPGKATNGKLSYWRPPPKYLKAGYRVKSILLPTDATEAAAKCREYTREMVRWYEGTDKKVVPGTWGYLIGRYKGDDVSPLRDVKANTREEYLLNIARWEVAISADLIENCTYAEAKRWQRTMIENGRSVSYIKRQFTMLRILVGYGVALKIPGARDAQDVLGELRLKAPKPRSATITREQVLAIVAKADEAGETAFGTGYLAQWWLSLRAVDVRGHWLRSDDKSGIIRGNFRWQDGLTWDMIDADIATITKTPSKTEEALPDALVLDITPIPELRDRLRSIPMEKRVGPVIVDRHGMPYDRFMWAKLFRRFRDAAGVPDHIKMMDTRAGATNDAKRLGASTLQMQHQLNHASPATTERYIRERSDTANNVIRLRAGEH